MDKPDPLTEFDAALKSRARTVMPTALSTAELRELGPLVLGRSVFTARGVSAIYASKLKSVIDLLAAGDIGEGQARTALYETLDALGYTPEGGFPGHEGEVPPAVRGSLEDLRSFRRMDLVVQTQLALMVGAGEQYRGHKPESLTEFPAWELVRVESREVPRDWAARWVIAGKTLLAGRMIAFKGDPVWGELGSYDNFQDALGVDHPPFAFLSGMGWREISTVESEVLGVTGPAAETADEWFATRPITQGGPLPMPTPQISIRDLDPALVEQFQAATHGTSKPATPQVMDYSSLLERELAVGRDAYQKANPDYRL